MEGPKIVGGISLLEGILAYVLVLIPILGIVSGVIVFLVSSNRQRLRFHAVQAIFLSLILVAIGIIFAVLGFLSALLFVTLIAWLYGMYVGYLASKGTDTMMPVIGEQAERFSKT